MKKFLSLLMLLTVAIPSLMAAEKSYTIMLDNGTNNGSTAVTVENFIKKLVTSGSEYISSVIDTQRVYPWTGYAKIGTGSKSGYFTLAISRSAQVVPTKIVLNAQKYNTDTGKLKINLNGKDTTFGSETTPGSNFTDLEFSDASFKETVQSIQISTTTLRANVKSITIYYEAEDTELTAPVISGVENGGVYRNSATVNISKPELASFISYKIKKGEKTVASADASETDFSQELTEAGSYTVTASATDGTDSKVAEEVSFEIVIAADVTGNIVIADQTGDFTKNETLSNVTVTLVDDKGTTFDVNTEQTYISTNDNTIRFYNGKNNTITSDYLMKKIEFSVSGTSYLSTTDENWNTVTEKLVFESKDGAKSFKFKSSATTKVGSIKITYLHCDKVDDGAALIGMEKGKFYQVNVNLQGVEANGGVLYARTAEASAAPSEPGKNYFDKSYEDYDLTKFDQRDWVAINGNTELVGKTLTTGFIARYDGVKLTPVAAIEPQDDAASYTLNTFGVANVFYGKYENTGSLDMGGYRPFFVKAKVNEVANYVGEVKAATDGGLELWGSGVCGKLNDKGLKIEANGIDIAASTAYQQIEGVLVADAAANGGVKLVALADPTTPTGVAALKADGKATVYGTEGAVVVNGADGKVMIFDAMGRMVKSVNAEGAATVAMPAGYYIVRTAGTAAKVIVK